VRARVGRCREGAAHLLRGMQVAEMGHPAGVFETRAEAEGRAVMTTWPRFLFLGPKPLRCRIGFHAWSGWKRIRARRYEPIAETEGLVVFTLYQTHMCYDCGAGQNERDVLSVRKITPVEAIGTDLITEAERKGLRKSPLADLQVGIHQDIEDFKLTKELSRRLTPAQTNCIGMLCRVGLHRYQAGRCFRCRRLGLWYRQPKPWWAALFIHVFQRSRPQ
jgi:hypothetical protein